MIKNLLFISIVCLQINLSSCTLGQPDPKCRIKNLPGTENGEALLDPHPLEVEWFPAFVGGKAPVIESGSSPTLVENQSIHMVLDGNDITNDFVPAPDNPGAPSQSNSIWQYNFRAPPPIYEDGMHTFEVFCDGASYLDKNKTDSVQFEAPAITLPVEIAPQPGNSWAMDANGVYVHYLEKGSNTTVPLEIPLAQLQPLTVAIEVIEADPSNRIMELDGQFPASQTQVIIPQGDVSSAFNITAISTGEALLFITSPGYEQVYLRVMILDEFPIGNSGPELPGSGG